MVYSTEWQELIEAYREKVGTIMFLEPSNQLALIDASTDTVYAAPEGETPKGFRAKLDHTLVFGRNMFFQTYQTIEPYPDEDLLY